jgi:methylenetetrahydrofolate--tRNA-(uracil-5-)-methyltransferase
MTEKVVIIGGGLAGCEAAWQVAKRDVPVDLFEMRPMTPTGAHSGDGLAEFVCSNSLGSQLPDRASGLMMSELRVLGSLLLDCAQKTAVPAGGSLAVDRYAFSRCVMEKMMSHPNIKVIREEVKEIPSGIVIVASGPLTSKTLSDSIGRLSGEEHLFFYDAIAPIIDFDSIDMTIAYRASRFGRGVLDEGDYINCPLTKEEYNCFYQELIQAERNPLKSFEGASRTSKIL